MLPRVGGIVEQPADLHTIPERFAARAENVIAEEVAAMQPFFLYLALTHTHVPLTPADRFWKDAKHAQNRTGMKGGPAIEYAATLREAQETKKGLNLINSKEKKQSRTHCLEVTQYGTLQILHQKMMSAQHLNN